MHFHDPERKRIVEDGDPMLENFQSVIPHLMVYPGDGENQWILSCFLPTGFNTHSYFQVTCHGPALNQLLMEYVANPESFFKDSMGWTPPLPREAKPTKRLNLTIEDLGL